MSNLNVIYAWREAHDVSVKEFARMVGVQSSAVCKWERGEVSAKKALKVHEVTGIALHRLRPDIYPEPSKRQSPQSEAAWPLPCPPPCPPHGLSRLVCP